MINEYKTLMKLFFEDEIQRKITLLNKFKKFINKITIRKHFKTK